MTKYIDFIMLVVTLFLSLLIVFSLAIKNIWINILLSTVASILISMCIIKIKNKKSGKIKYQYYSRYCIYQGNSYVLSFVQNILDKTATIKDNYILLSNGEMVFCSVKFGNVTNDEILKYFNLTKQNSSTKFYLIAKSLDRNVMLIANNLEIPFTYIPLKVVYRIAKKQNQLPTITKSIKTKRSITGNIFGFIFAPSNFKRYLFVAIILMLTSYLIPFKIYYISLGCVNLVLALICLFNRRSSANYGKYGVFNQFTNKRMDTNEVTPNEDAGNTLDSQ